MPVTKLKVTFNKVYANDCGDIVGAGEWKLTAKIDGKTVGDPNHEFEVRDKEMITLSDKWSRELDLTDKLPGDKIEISMKGIDVDVISDDELGEAKLTLKYPFATKYDNVPIASSVVKGFFKDKQYFQMYVSVQQLEVKATITPDKTKGILVSRQNDGSSTFTTISGKAVTPRIEICPVVPVPVSPTKLPPRPKAMEALKAELAPGADTEHAAAIELDPAMEWNCLANPSFIPYLKKSDPDLTKKAALIGVTWAWPGDLELSKLTWHIKEGPIEFVGEATGSWVKVRGTDSSADKMAVIEVRWDGEKGPLMATFRAWTGPVKEVRYRVNIINGVDPVKHPERSPTVTPDDCLNYMKVAQLIWWQCGIEFVPDPDTTAWDKAVASTHTGIFTVPAEKDNWTVNVNNNVSPIATRLNFNPGVINVAFVRSTTGTNAAAVDLQGVSGKKEELDGFPSTSWVLPSGVPPDAAAKKIKMDTFPHQNRSNSSDAAYVKARKKVQASFSTDDIKKRLYGVIYPSDWTASSSVHASGQNMAHELGHILCLFHRGSGGENNWDTKTKLSDDGVNSEDDKGKKRGHPWRENVMGYDVQRGLDVDLIQTAAVRKHPGLKNKA